MNCKNISLYNTLTRKLEPLQPVEPGKVRLYCCGPTVYNYQHIGNLRTYIFEDLLARILRFAGYAVEHVMNITDVGHLVGDGDVGEDKMALAAKREKKKSEEIADFYTGIFFEDCAKLNIIKPGVVCKATEHIHQMINLILRLEQRGFTYGVGGNVYFDISKLADYGKLAKLQLDKLSAGARIEVDDNKRNPADFVLWFTKSKFENQELQWDSPWGRGYPGWHIECSAMAIHYLGEEFDIHCGGIDHIPVHHTNEIAQSEGATGKPWVNIWMHGNMLVNDQKEKMAKSSGGFLTVKAVQEQGYEPLAYRFLCLGAHYRSELSFSWESLTSAAQSLAKLKRTVISWREAAENTEACESSASYLSQFEECLFDDLNMPRAVAVLWAAAGDAKLGSASKLLLLEKFDEVLGLGIASWKLEQLVIPVSVKDLLEQRLTARKDKQWALSDQLRDQIKALGYSVEDAGGQQKIRRV